MKVTVFGGTGYVGGYLVDELLDKGHHPVLLVRPESRHKVRHSERCTLIDGDIASTDSVRAALSGADAVIYNIGVLREFPSSGVTYEALHFEGARRAMDAAEEAGARRFLLMSANGVKADGTGYQAPSTCASAVLRIDTSTTRHGSNATSGSGSICGRSSANRSRTLRPWMLRLRAACSSTRASRSAEMAASDSPCGIGVISCRRTPFPRASTPPLSCPSPTRAKHGSNR